jgi:hypothetical protein
MSAAMGGALHEIDRAFAADGDTRVHVVTFERNIRTQKWRSRCSCGWITYGDEDRVKIEAASHDREWVPVVVKPL